MASRLRNKRHTRFRGLECIRENAEYERERGVQPKTDTLRGILMLRTGEVREVTFSRDNRPPGIVKAWEHGEAA